MIRAKSAQGFTLIEILMAMTLLSIMMVLLFGSLKICAESWERGENKITEVSEIAAVANFFQRHLSMARPLWSDFKVDEKIFSFQGKKQAVQFVSSFPASAGRAGLQLISVELHSDFDGQFIKVTLKPFFPLAEDEEWLQEEEILVKHVEQFSLAYFGADELSYESRWQDQWLEKERLPRLVKIRIGLDNGLFWPDMVLELKMANTENIDQLFGGQLGGGDENGGADRNDLDGFNASDE